MNEFNVDKSNSKPCIFIPIEQFFPQKHNTFLRVLASRFHLILSSKTNWLHNNNNKNIEYLEDIIKVEKDPTDSEEYSLAKKQLDTFLQNYVEKITGKAIRSQSLINLEKTIENKVKHAFRITRMFRKLLNCHAVDMVIVSAEYSYLSRPVVIEAKKRNIPVVDIEHGFFGANEYPEAFKVDPHFKNLFISDYVIVDNNIEAEILKRHYKDKQQIQSVKFLPMGTPLDNVRNALPKKDIALKSLKIPSGKPVLSLFTTWCEARSVWQVFQQQFDEFQFLESTFKCLQETGLANSLNVIIKLHPSISLFREYSIVNLITDLAKSKGINQVVVSLDKIDDIIAASDFMITSTCSSVLWEGLLAERPIAFKPSHVWLSKMNIHCVHDNNEMVKSDLMNYVFNSSELEAFIRRYMNFDEKKAYRLRAQQFKNKWNVKSETAEHKSEFVARWITEKIQERRSQTERSHHTCQGRWQTHC